MLSPFRVSLKIRGPYIPPTFMPLLDGLLWGAAARVLGRPPQAEEVPLRQTDGIYHASAMVAPPGLDVAGKATFRQNILRDDAETLPASLLSARGDGDISKLRDGVRDRGAFKPKQNIYPTLLPHPDAIDIVDGWPVWSVHFFGVGDAERTAWLLRQLPGIGRKAARGYGALDGGTDAVTVRPAEDFSWLRSGRPMRPLPVVVWRGLAGADPDWPVTSAAVAPPYGEAPRVSCVAPDGFCLAEEAA